MTYYTCSNLASPLTPRFHCAHGVVVHACQDTFFFETEPAKELPIVLIRREGPNILDSGYVVCIQIQLLALNNFSLESI